MLSMSDPWLAWLAECAPKVGGLDLDQDEPGRRCRRRFKRHTPNRSSPYSNLPLYWASGCGSNTDFTNAGEELDASRPGLSFTCLIGLAILADQSDVISVGKIYAFLQRNFPYFRDAKSTWRNSVRHVLSLDKHFYKQQRHHAMAGDAHLHRLAREGQQRGPRSPATGAQLKGGLWGVKPRMVPTLLSLIDQGRCALAPATAQHLRLDDLRARCAAKQQRLKAAPPLHAPHSQPSPHQATAAPRTPPPPYPHPPPQQQRQSQRQHQHQRQRQRGAAVPRQAKVSTYCAPPTQQAVQRLLVAVVPGLGVDPPVPCATMGPASGRDERTVPDTSYGESESSCASSTALFEGGLGRFSGSLEGGWSSSDSGWSSGWSGEDEFPHDRLGVLKGSLVRGEEPMHGDDHGIDLDLGLDLDVGGAGAMPLVGVDCANELVRHEHAHAHGRRGVGQGQGLVRDGGVMLPIFATSWLV